MKYFTTYVSAAIMSSPSDLVPFDLAQRAVECENLEDMTSAVRDLLKRSCAAYGIQFQPKAKKQKTTREEEGFGQFPLA